MKSMRKHSRRGLLAYKFHRDNIYLSTWLTTWRMRNKYQLMKLDTSPIRVEMSVNGARLVKVPSSKYSKLEWTLSNPRFFKLASSIFNVLSSHWSLKLDHRCSSDISTEAAVFEIKTCSFSQSYHVSSPGIAKWQVP